MWRGMRPARRPILLSPSDSCHPLAPSACSVPTATTSFPPPFQTLVSFAVEKIVFISTVVRTDSAAVIYVPAQTHLIYSAKHNSLTLFLGENGRISWLRHQVAQTPTLVRTLHSFLDILHFAFSFPSPFSFRLPIISTIAYPYTFFATLSLSFFSLSSP